MLTTGITGSISTTVTKENTAKAMKSGTLDVYASPAMIALMEQTASESVAPYLEEGQGSVGIHLDISHDAPTPLGKVVTCHSTLTDIQGRCLTFQVTASDETGIIGQGTHKRFIIDEQSFMKKASAR